MAKQTSDTPDAKRHAEQTIAVDSSQETSQETSRATSQETSQETSRATSQETSPESAYTEAALDADGAIDIAQLLERLAEAEAATQQSRNDYLRVQAEMQNLRRRTEQDIEKAHKYGQERFSSELLSVMDNLERALESASGSEDAKVKAIYDGVKLTCKSFMDCLKRFNIEPIDPLGEPFDPQLHQAMSLRENPEVEPNTVIAVLQKGYTLHGRVIRPAMVLVSK